MKAHLLHRDRDLDLERPLPAHAAELEQDLGLAVLFEVMAAGDAYLRPLVERVLLEGLSQPGAIRYRQAALRDCLERREVVRDLYALAGEASEAKRRAQVMWFRDTPDALLAKSLRILKLLADLLGRLRAVADDHSADFRSEAFTRLFAMLGDELDDEYLHSLARQLKALEFRRGTLVSARLGAGNRGTDYVLRRPHERTLFERLLPRGRASYGFTVAPRDEAGLETLAWLRGRGIAAAARVLAQSADHLLGFFALLRAELGFYVGCVNLHERLAAQGGPTSFPEPVDDGAAFGARGLYDPVLALHRGGPVVGNDVEADGKLLLMVTGANEGGKSTFLRSVGLAQLMMQAGVFVAAESVRADVRGGVLTHFKREEDETMQKGKLDEELSRMSELVEHIRPGALVLCNESFASTSEREGSEIARQVVFALVEAGVKVVYVTHLYDLAETLHAEELDTALFLRAERLADGTRTFRMLPAEPLPTSHGIDSYRRVFGRDPAVGAA